jgi:hypothetical protein
MKIFFLLIILQLASFTFTPTGIPLVLRNTSLVAVPLTIPGVMNPRLSPMSTSHLELNIGQKIYFKYKDKDYLLLEVDGSLEGKTLDVPKLIRERKKVLNL